MSDNLISDKPWGLIQKCICCQVKIERSEPQVHDNENNPLRTATVIRFDLFCSVLGLDKSPNYNNVVVDDDFESEKPSEFCENCSAIIMKLKNLQELLEKMKASIQVEMDLIKKTVQEAANYSTNCNNDSDDMDKHLDEIEINPRVAFVWAELLADQQSKSPEDRIQIQNDDDADNLIELEDIEIKLESYSEELPQFASHVDYTEDHNEEPNDDPDQSNSPEGFLSDLIISPHSKSRSDKRNQIKSYLSGDVNERKRKRFDWEDAPSTKSKNVNKASKRPTRKKKKLRFTDYEDPEPAEVTEDKSHLSDDQLLSKFGLDKGPQLKIRLQPVEVVSAEPRSRRPLRKAKVAKMGETSVDPFDDHFDPGEPLYPSEIVSSASEESETEFKCRPGPKSLKTRRGAQKSDNVKCSKTKLDSSQPPITALPKKSNKRKTKGLSKFNEAHLQNSIILDNGKRHYKSEEIIEVDNHWLCTFKLCDFKLLKETDDTESCKMMLQHFKIVHANDKYWCEHCETYFGKIRQFSRHNKHYHSSGKPPSQECPICQKPVRLGVFKTHHLTHFNSEERAKWVAEGKVDPVAVNRKRYKKVLAEGLHQCDICGKKFPHKFYLDSHKETHNDHTQRQKFICEHCGRIYSTKVGLYYHDMREHNPEEFLGKWKCCLICEKKFQVQTHLDIHMSRCHGAPKKHKCDKCDRAFSDSYSLKKHGVVHSDDPRPHKCPFCPGTYPYENNLYRHIENSHKDKDFVRPQCKTKPRRVNSKPPQRPIMTCKQMFPCELCDKPFPLPCKLKKHMHLSHGQAEDKPRKYYRIGKSVEEVEERESTPEVDSQVAFVVRDAEELDNCL